MIGTRISCTKCNRKIDVMSPEEEGSIPYELGGAVEKMKPRGPTQEELDELAEKEERERRLANWVMFKHITSIILLLIRHLNCRLSALSWLRVSSNVISLSNKRPRTKTTADCQL